MAPPKSDFEKQMQYLDAEIRRLEAEFNMFFAGRLPRPPWETRTKVAALVKKHDQSYIRNTADRFRFETLQNRYAKFIELCDRQMNNRELGRPTFGVRKVSEAPPAPAKTAAAEATPESSAAGPEGKRPEAAAAPTPAAVAAAAAAAREDKREERAVQERIVKFGRQDDTGAGAARVKELYEKLAEAKKQAGEAPVPFDRVQALVRAQVNKFASEGANVAFKVALKDGKVSLTVKPEKEE